jgi:hypothetical protein
LPGRIDLALQPPQQARLVIHGHLEGGPAAAGAFFGRELLAVPVRAGPEPPLAVSHAAPAFPPPRELAVALGQAQQPGLLSA